MSNEEIPKDYDFKKEKVWEQKWEDEDIYKYIGDGSRPRYIIDTPPPYPTGSIHLGHVLNWVYIDMNARYRRQKGHDVLFTQGWDCHGLPTEVKVEETHGIKKNDVSRTQFRQYCVDLTTENIAKMKSQMRAMGYSQDWSREFVTMTPEYMRKTQYSFLKMYEEGLIYQGKHPVNWCPRCQTAIAFAEVEYSDNTTFLNYVNFPPAVEDSYDDIVSSQKSGKQADPKDEGILIATTRPELMAACVAVVIHPEDERYTHLLGKYVEVPLSHQKVKIIADEEVDPEFGTGAVMICTFGDKTDVSWVQKYDLEVIDIIDDAGILTAAAGRYEGMDLQSCKKQTIEDLDSEGYLLKQEEVDQNVGQCWRCKTPVEILLKKQWFVAVRDLIEKTKTAADEMKWVPEHMKSRMVNWADSMEWDWCISRQRIFATPIPVWYCKDCGKVILPDVEDLPIDPTVDKPKHACECGCEEFIGEVDVLDTWMDSSISPLSIAGWPDEDYVNHFPSNIRPQGHDIIRTWAFYTTLRCIALTGQKPFDDIVINGMVFGEDGNKMSKSRPEFVVGPEEVIEKYGADPLRIWAANSVPGSDVIFDWKDIKHGYRFLRKFWNAFRFISMQIFDEEVTYEEVKDNLGPLDLWILSKLNNLNKTVDQAFADYNFADTITSIERFFWHDFCDEYIEAVKYRLYSDVSDESRRAAKYTLRTVVETSLKLMAPIAPFFTEEVYQYFSDESIHTTLWPEVYEELISEEMEEKGETTVELIDEVRRFKSASKIPLNAELAEVNVYTTDDDLVEIFNEFDDDLKGTLKINELAISSGKPEVHEKIIEVEPDMSQIGPTFKGDAGKIIGYLKSTDIDEIGSVLEESHELTIGEIVVPEDMLNIKKEIVGASGKKVDILQSENLDMIVEVIR
ncbi:MAG: valine--tRNA ligase [Methanobrevibacter sp.]|uniref:valine--tRNA ligase n=1 Tax=Methanobrevibacter sp. TaxID=66852 RepID=UPI0025DC7956|nr:valine--tRNA ligase [Methanobrevibacter sp.]MBQ8018520.1 valine--tRNA ligase [Methanobrevibacter sp.]